jgi:hypothetical protein
MNVAAAALAAGSRDKTISLANEISKDMIIFRIFNYRTKGNKNNFVVSLTAMHFFALSMAPTFCVEMGGITKIKKRKKTMRGFNNYRSAVPAVTPIGTAFGNILLTSETDTTASPISALDKEFCLIDERHLIQLYCAG